MKVRNGDVLGDYRHSDGCVSVRLACRESKS